MAKVPEIQINGAGDCENVRDILRVIQENWPFVRDQLICDMADIEMATLQIWRERGTARLKNVQRLIDYIKDQPEDWDGGPEVVECGNRP